MAYEFRALRRQKALDGITNTAYPLKTALVLDGAKVNVDTTAKITIYKPGNATALVTAASMTITGSLLTYAVIATGSDWTVGQGYRGELVVVHGGVTYNGHIIFDVVNFLLLSDVTADQLIDRDDGLRSADWAGDDDLSGLIEATRDELQILVEAMAFDTGKHVLEDMIIDQGKFSTCHRIYCLEAFWRARENHDAADNYQRTFKTLWKAFVNSIKYDANQDGEEDKPASELVQQRLVT